MKKLLPVLALILSACGSDDPEVEEPRDPFFTEAEWTVIQGLSPLPPLPASPTNRFADNADAARLGQKFFFDTRFSGALVEPDNARPGGNGQVGQVGKVSCATCHMGESLFVDSRSTPNNVSLGLRWGTRNTPTVINAAFLDFQFWDARADSLWLQATRPLQNHREQGVTLLGLAHVINRHYRTEYVSVFGSLPDLQDTRRFPPSGGPAFPEEGIPESASWTSMNEADRDIIRRIAANFGKAIEAYERKLVSGNSEFDRYVSGQHDLFVDAASGPVEKRGLKVFIGVGRCILCHTGPLMTDNLLHNVGVRQQLGPHVPARDDGAGPAFARLMQDPMNGAGVYSDNPASGRAKLDAMAARAPQPGQFRTTPLRNIRQTGPYFHNGSHGPGLTDVIELYRVGGDPAGTFTGTLDPLMVPLGEDVFRPTEAFDLERFLWTLTGEPIDASLRTAPVLPP